LEWDELVFTRLKTIKEKAVVDGSQYFNSGYALSTTILAHVSAYRFISRLGSVRLLNAFTECKKYHNSLRPKVSARRQRRKENST
jgi:hypothetical protein